MDITQDNDVLIEHLLKIRSGILSQSWDEVLDGYISLSGDEISLPKKQNRSDLIKEKLQEKLSNKTVEPDAPTFLETKEGDTVCITNAFDKEEFEANQKRSAKTLKVPRQKSKTKDGGSVKFNPDQSRL